MTLTTERKPGSGRKSGPANPKLAKKIAIDFKKKIQVHQTVIELKCV
jgi:hypothetical protein